MLRVGTADAVIVGRESVTVTAIVRRYGGNPCCRTAMLVVMLMVNLVAVVMVVRCSRSRIPKTQELLNCKRRSLRHCPS